MVKYPALLAVVLGMDDKRLRYDDLVKDNGLDSGAREIAA